MSRFTQDAGDGAADVSVRRLEAEMTMMRETHHAEMTTMRETHHAEIAALRATHDADRVEIQSMRAQLEHITSVMHMFMPPQVR